MTGTSTVRNQVESHHCGDAQRLIHLLNQRYRAEFDRAERLQAALLDIESSLAWRLLGWIRRLKGRSTEAATKGSETLTRSDVAFLDCSRYRPDGRVSIIIPFKDQPYLLRSCLRSLRQTSYSDYEIVLVNNGSEQVETHQFLRRLALGGPWRIINRPGRFNFSRLCNQGAAAAKGEWLLFLNNDIEVIDECWLEQMLVVAQHPRVGVVGATLLYPDLTIQHAGMAPSQEGWVHLHRGLPEDVIGVDSEMMRVRTVPAVTGACFLIHRQLFGALRGFNELLPVTSNDVELCQRVKQRGSLIAVTPHARLIHYESLSRGYARELMSE